MTVEALDTFALFNPAFAASVLAAAAAAHVQRLHEPMPVALAFLVVPLSLHAPFRQRLPGNARKSLAGWLTENLEVTAAYPSVARSYVPMTRRGLRAGLRTRALWLDNNALRGAVTTPDAAALGDEVVACLDAARLAGRWLGLAGDPALTYPLLGVRP